MARAPRTQPKIEPVRADLKWDEEAQFWTASATVPLPSGNRRFAESGVDTTQAMHLLKVRLAAEGAGDIELVPKLHMPEEDKAIFSEFQKRIKVYLENKEYVTRTRIEIALRLRKKHVPMQTIAPLVGMSKQRLGRLLQAHQLGIKTGPVGRPRRHGDNTDDYFAEDDDDE